MSPEDVSAALAALDNPADAPVALRFLRKVRADPGSGCWIWVGCVQDSSKRVRARGAKSPPDWRGRFWWSGGTEYAHRAAWRLWRGNPDGFEVMHSECDNSICVNPWHLSLGDHADNMADMAEKGRARAGSAAPTPF